MGVGHSVETAHGLGHPQLREGLQDGIHQEDGLHQVRGVHTGGPPGHTQVGLGRGRQREGGGCLQETLDDQARAVLHCRRDQYWQEGQ